MVIDVFLQHGINRKTVIHICSTHFFDKFKQITIFCRYLVSLEQQSRSWICWWLVFDKIKYFVNYKLEKFSSWISHLVWYYDTSMTSLKQLILTKNRFYSDNALLVVVEDYKYPLATGRFENLTSFTQEQSVWHVAL